MDYSIRACESLDELGACVALQRQIWGYAEHEVYPLRLFVTLTKTGGHVPLPGPVERDGRDRTRRHDQG